MRRPVRALAWAVQAWLAAGTAYLLALLGVAAAPPHRGRDRAEPAGEPLELVTLVPAHDEGAGVAPTVRGLLAQDHPADRRHVVVIADNCTDDTAGRAAAAGAVVWERHDPQHRGKGRALAWAIERVRATWPAAGAVVVVDADCVPTPNLLAAIDRRMRAGAAAVQTDYRVSNPDASDAAARRWAGFALMHAVRARAKTRLGLSCGLFGTGMAFRADVLREVPWTSFSITEDAEHHVRLVEAGHVVVFAEEAAVLSPMPTTEAAAADQQTRWEAGNLELARRSVGRLLADGARRGDLQRLHAAFEQLVPPQSVLAAGSPATVLTGLAVRDRRLVAAGAATLAGQAAYVLGGLAAAGAPAPVWRSLAAAPQLVVRKLAQLARIGSGGGPTEFIRTTRAPAAAPEGAPAAGVR